MITAELQKTISKEAFYQFCLAKGGLGVLDHGALTGLGDDDHTQYVLKSGSITQLTTRNHSDIQNIGANDHHNRQHALNSGSDHTGRIDKTQMPSGVLPLLSRIAYTRLTSNQTNVTFNSFSLARGETLILYGSVVNPQGSNSNISLFFADGDTTASRYNHQYIAGNASTASAARTADAVIGVARSSNNLIRFMATIYHDAQDKPFCFVSDLEHVTTSVILAHRGIYYNYGAVVPLTSIVVNGSVASSLGTDSHFALYKTVIE